MGHRHVSWACTRMSRMFPKADGRSRRLQRRRQIQNSAPNGRTTASTRAVTPGPGCSSALCHAKATSVRPRVLTPDDEHVRPHLLTGCIQSPTKYTRFKTRAAHSERTGFYLSSGHPVTHLLTPSRTVPSHVRRRGTRDGEKGRCARPGQGRWCRQEQPKKAELQAQGAAILGHTRQDPGRPPASLPQTCTPGQGSSPRVSRRRAGGQPTQDTRGGGHSAFEEEAILPSLGGRVGLCRAISQTESTG